MLGAAAGGRGATGGFRVSPIAPGVVGSAALTEPPTPTSNPEIPTNPQKEKRTNAPAERIVTSKSRFQAAGLII